MAQRTLRIAPDLLVQILKGMDSDPRRRWLRVVRDPIPDDAKIVSVRYSPYYADTVDVLLESDAWPELGPGHRIEPQLAVDYEDARVFAGD